MQKMQDIIDATTAILEEMDLFLVEFQAKPSGKVLVRIDGKKGVTIAECGKISKFIGRRFEEAEANFEIEVSSPGLDKPFKVWQQYEKNIGKSVSVETHDGRVLSGNLVTACQESLELLVKETKDVPEALHLLRIDQIKTTKINISF